MSLAPDPRSGLEMSLLRLLAFKPALPAAGQGSGGNADVAEADTGKAETAVTRREVVAKTQTVNMSHETAFSDEDNSTYTWPVDVVTWSCWVDEWNVGGLLGQLLANTVPASQYRDGCFELILSEQAEHLYNSNREKEIEQILQQKTGIKNSLELRIGITESETPAQRMLRMNDEAQLAASAAIESDPNIKALQDTFNAKLKPGSVRPRTH